MDRDSADVAVNQFALAGMKSRTNLQAQRTHLLAHGPRATYGARRAIEGGKQPITGGIHLVATEGTQFSPQHRVVVAEKLAPPRIAQFGRAFGGASDIDEHDGGEHSVRFEMSACAGYELLDLVRNDVLSLLIEHQVIEAGKLDVLCPRDVVGQVAARTDRHEVIADAMQYQRRRLNRRQQMTNVDFVIRCH